LAKASGLRSRKRGSSLARLSPADTYRRDLRLGGALPAVAPVLRETFALDSVETRDADGARTYAFTISTARIDRDRDTIAVAGWHTDSFMRCGGPVLYAHESRGLPIGRATRVYVDGGALKAEMVFAPAEANPFAEWVRRLVDFGALRATSVGFRPLPGRAAWNEERNGIDFLEQELLEFSIVPVPSNVDAVQERAVGAARRRSVAGAVELAAAQALDAQARSEKAVALALAIAKRGRVLSQANEERIRGAHANGEALMSALTEVLAQVEAMPEAEEPKSAPAAPPPPPAHVVRLIPESERRFRISAADVRSATRAALTELVNAEIRRHTGRLD
jgi:HK97 family phage prohead protease